MSFFSTSRMDQKSSHPFWVLVAKEITDHIRSWRFIILLFLILLTCISSLYTSVSNITKVISKPGGAENGFLFLKLFTLSDGSLPPFHIFIGFLGPLLGISLGFDAINSEQNGGTLSRVMAQPIHRDYLINAKFIGALIIIGTLFLALGLGIIGLGIIVIGIPPMPQEVLRILCFLLLSTFYVAFWLNLSIFFSLRFRQAATSALTAIAVWLFFTVFYQIIISIVAKALVPTGPDVNYEALGYQKLVSDLLRIVPNQLYTEATTTLLMPSVRSLGPLTMEQVYGAIPNPLPITESLTIVWPQLTGLLAATILCFAASYYYFMKREIRSR